MLDIVVKKFGSKIIKLCEFFVFFPHNFFHYYFFLRNVVTIFVVQSIIS